LDADFMRREAEKWRRVKRGSILSVPVPTRTMPEIIDNAGAPQVVTHMEKWKALVDVTVRQKPASNGKALRTLGEGKDWIVTLKQGAWYKGRDSKGREGWAPNNTLEYVEEVTTPPGSAGIESAAPAAFASRQLFRVYRVAWTLETVEAYARHISYDFGKNLLAECAMHFVDGYTALRQMMLKLYVPGEDFQCYTDIAARAGVATDKKSVDWTRVNPIMALLDPEIGFCETYKAEAVRDNFNIYLLRQAGMDRGFSIRYGTNMTGVTWDENEADVVTRIVPIGADKNGQPLLLPERFVDSAHIGDYPVVACEALDVPDARIGEKNEDDKEITATMAYTMMREAAQAEYENGADLPAVTLAVDFINLGDTQEYAEYRQLRQLFMHDIVYVEHARLGLSLCARVVKTTWDVLAQRYTGVEISTKGVDTPTGRIASWQVPCNVQGVKIRAGTVSAVQLAPGAADSAKLGPDAVVSGNIAPNAVTNKQVADAALDQAKIAGLTADLLALDQRLQALGG
jgi:phage minor structural protein